MTESEATETSTFDDSFEYELFGNVQQHVYLNGLATRLEQQRFDAATSLDLAMVTGADNESQMKGLVESLTKQIERVRERIKGLPPLTDDEQSQVAETRMRMMGRPDRGRQSS